MWDIPEIEGIPPSYMPIAEQVPSWASMTADDVRRFAACFALGRLMLGYDSPGWVRALYHSGIPTDAVIPTA